MSVCFLYLFKCACMCRSNVQRSCWLHRDVGQHTHQRARRQCRMPQLFGGGLVVHQYINMLILIIYIYVYILSPSMSSQVNSHVELLAQLLQEIITTANRYRTKPHIGCPGRFQWWHYCRAGRGWFGSVGDLRDVPSFRVDVRWPNRHQIA